MNTARINSKKEVVVITKDNPWDMVPKDSNFYAKLKKSGVIIEVIQLSWKASEEWKVMEEKGFIKYNYLGKLYGVIA